MSQAKLTLRPPPNVDFVQGYPGIPPGAERPQAAVKGAIEVRVNQQGVKAKWVRIELRKVEVLPGGGQAGTFFDYVGQSPVNLWTATDGDYGILRPQDFPFYIRIPESLPPTIALEKGAGIKYELIAMVCIKGKKGFFRRRKSSVLSTASQIVIDKHELHSTWPIYSQPETRHLAQDGVTLGVERGQTCYGPGDRISVLATLKSDSLHTVILRGFEFTLKETTVFRAGPHTTGKKGAPQVKVTIIAEQKLPVNATLYGGTQHKTELTCTVPSYHTSATINAARHIDITYALTIKALMGMGLPVVIHLPVIVSNWPRNVSIEAARRIGTAPNLSMVPVHATEPVAATSQSAYVTRPRTSDRDRSDPVTGISGASTAQFNTAPTPTTNGYAGLKSPDEMGYVAKPSYNTVSGPQSGTSQFVSSQPGSSSYVHEPTKPGSSAGRPGSAGGGRPGSIAVGGRPGSSGSGGVSRSTANTKLTVANMGDDIPEESPISAVRPSQRMPPPATTTWISAEEEKRRLYEIAKAQVDRVQGVPAPQRESPSPQHMQSPGHVDAGPLMQGPGARPSAWSTAEAEKERLYEQAQATARRTQGLAASHAPSLTANSPISPPPVVSAGAALYQQAMSAVNREASSPPFRTQSTSPTQNPVSRAPVSQYPSAESEKTALKRYYEAKAAASRAQGQDYTSSEPISYDALYPVNNSESSQAPSAPSPLVTNGDNDLPPAFNASSSQHPILSEKERLRRHYEAQDAAIAPRLTSSPPPLSPPQTIPIAVAPSRHTPPPTALNSVTNGVSEKELLRRKYEAEDSAAAQVAVARVPPTPPPRSRSQSSGHGLPPIPRSPPVPPSPRSPIQPLTAAEEKARLRAKYEAEDALAVGSASGVSPDPMPSNHSNPPLPTPPPLRPRPPVHYIRETQEEDSRTQSQLYTLDKGSSVNGHPTGFERPRQYSLQGFNESALPNS